MAPSAAEPAGGRVPAIGLLDRLQRIGAGVETLPCNGHGVVVLDRIADAVALVAAQRSHTQQVVLAGAWCPWRHLALADCDLLSTEVVRRAASVALRQACDQAAIECGIADQVERLFNSLPVLSPFERQRSSGSRRRISVSGPADGERLLSSRAGLRGLPLPISRGDGIQEVQVEEPAQLVDLLPVEWYPVLPAAVVSDVVQASPGARMGMRREAILRGDRDVRLALAERAWAQGSPVTDDRAPGTALFDPALISGGPGEAFRAALKTRLGGPSTVHWWQEPMQVVMAAGPQDEQRLALALESLYASLPVFRGEDQECTIILDAALLTGPVADLAEQGLRLGRKVGLSLVIVADLSSEAKTAAVMPFGDFRLNQSNDGLTLSSGSGHPVSLPAPSPESLAPGLELLHG